MRRTLPAPRSTASSLPLVCMSCVSPTRIMWRGYFHSSGWKFSLAIKWQVDDASFHFMTAVTSLCVEKNCCNCCCRYRCCCMYFVAHLGIKTNRHARNNTKGFIISFIFFTFFVLQILSHGKNSSIGRRQSKGDVGHELNGSSLKQALQKAGYQFQSSGGMWNSVGGREGRG